MTGVRLRAHTLPKNVCLFFTFVSDFGLWSGVGKRGLSTFNEKIEITKNSLKVPIRDFYFIKLENCFVNHATFAGLEDLHFGTFFKCDYLI